MKKQKNDWLVLILINLLKKVSGARKVSLVYRKYDKKREERI